MPAFLTFCYFDLQNRTQAQCSYCVIFLVANKNASDTCEVDSIHFSKWMKLFLVAYFSKSQLYGSNYHLVNLTFDFNGERQSHSQSFRAKQGCNTMVSRCPIFYTNQQTKVGQLNTNNWLLRLVIKRGMDNPSEEWTNALKESDTKSKNVKPNSGFQEHHKM